MDMIRLEKDGSDNYWADRTKTAEGCANIVVFLQRLNFLAYYDTFR